jgi:hypothetical protein
MFALSVFGKVSVRTTGRVCFSKAIVALVKPCSCSTDVSEGVSRAMETVYGFTIDPRAASGAED